MRNGDFDCCNRTINSELVVGQGDECAIGEDADND